MAFFKDHYDNLLADHYSWIFGGLEAKIEENEKFFTDHAITPNENSIAIDLGCGSGFQSIPLAKAGFNVTAVDMSEKLLEELGKNTKGLSVKTGNTDMLEFLENYSGQAELIVCMGDSLTHLDSLEDVVNLIKKSYDKLIAKGRLVLTFRDLSREPKGEEKIIPVRSEADRIFTCVLDHKGDHVDVYDMIYTRENGEWKLNKSFYRKTIVNLFLSLLFQGGLRFFR